jgi:transaldolase/glucose-6-phosphate isomerase
VEDIQRAADALYSVYNELKGADGYVSLEVSPYLARDTEGTIAERSGSGPALPGQPDGEGSRHHRRHPAIRALIAQGISINVTLLFSQKMYAEVLEAYIAGLEDFVAGGGDPKRIASVASFVSRIDTAVDTQLDGKIAAASGDDKAHLDPSRARSPLPMPNSPISII